MGHHNASSECNERMRIILKDIEGVAQIKDDIIIHGKGKQHEMRLEEVLNRLKEYNVMLRLSKISFRHSSGQVVLHDLL